MQRKTGRSLFIYFAWLSCASLFIYFWARLYIFTINSTGVLNVFVGILLLLAEGHAILQSLGLLTGLIRLKARGRERFHRVELDPRHLPAVTVLVPGRNEPLEVLERTFITLVSLDYANKRLVFLDGSDPEWLPKNRELALRYGLEHYHPEVAPRSKAEIINIFLPQITSPYLAIFDADQNPMPNFLKETVSLIEYSAKIAFVQTPQLYSNYEVSTVAKGAALQQSIFFEGICEAKASGNAMFCCGTNFLMRTAVLREVGGFDEASVTEDFATSVLIHSLGYRSVYFNHVRVFGMAPETLPAYFKQQFRWAAGTVGVIRELIGLLSERKVHLSVVQLWEYFLSATYYFSGWSFLILMLCPILYLIFDIPSYFANPLFYLATFLPYYLLTLLTFYATMRVRHYRVQHVFLGVVMGSLSFPILIKATIAVLLKRRLRFEITEKGRGGHMAWRHLWPWFSLIVANLVAIGFGVTRFHENHYAISINIAWCFYHTFILVNIFRLNGSPRSENISLNSSV